MPKIVSGISFDQTVLDETKKLAQADGRNLSNYINMVLARNILKVNGAAKPKKVLKRTGKIIRRKRG